MMVTGLLSLVLLLVTVKGLLLLVLVVWLMVVMVTVRGGS